MITCRGLVMSASLFAAIAAGASTDANAQTLSLVGSSTKICQLTGDTDWTTNQPTATRTNTRYGLVAVDLGFPVESGSRALYFLFGDARPSTTGAPIPPDDALGVTTRKSAPDSATCLDLDLVSPAPGSFAHPTVQPGILQGSFNVPTGGIFVDDAFYAFFWTDHCVVAQPLAPMPGAPLKLPAPVASLGSGAPCPEIPVFNSIGRSVLARSAPTTPAAFERVHPGPLPSRLLAEMPSGFVYVTAARLASEPPFGTKSDIVKRPADIPVFGVPRYRASIPYVAMAPQDTFADPETWSFYAADDGRTTEVDHARAVGKRT